MNLRTLRSIHVSILVFLLALFLAYPLSPRARAAFARPATLTDPCAYDSNNLFMNGMMRYPGMGSAYGTVAEGWMPFIFSGNPPNFNVVDNEGIDENPGTSQQIFEVNTFDAGIQQTVNNLQVGTNYWMRWGYSLAAKSYTGPNERVNTIGRQFGVNPYGGTDPHSAQIIWGPILWNGTVAVNRPEMTIVFTARATSATIFLRAIASVNDGGENRVWIDALCMEPRPDLPTSPPPPTPPITPSTPNPSTNYIPYVERNVTTPTSCTAMSVVTHIAIGAQPKGIAVDPATNRAFVSLFADSSVAVLDAATNQLTATWSTNNAGHSNGIAFANNRLFVAMRDTSSVAILDATNGAFIATHAVGSQPWGVGANSTRVWVANFASSTVSVFDAITNTVIATTPIGANPALVAPASAHAFVTFMGSGIATIANTGASLNNFPFDGGAFGVAFNASANRVYAASRDTNKLVLLNASTGATITSVTLAQTPYALAYTPNSNRLYIILADVNQVNIRDGTTLSDRATLALGAQGADGGDGIAVLNNRVYVSNNAAGTVSVIQDACP
ncbi:MAG: YncE family protein [Chloroflexi bacterium]|nr:YncE family protein [Chloroflexota bacterium]